MLPARLSSTRLSATRYLSGLSAAERTGALWRVVLAYDDGRLLTVFFRGSSSRLRFCSLLRTPAGGMPDSSPFVPESLSGPLLYSQTNSKLVLTMLRTRESLLLFSCADLTAGLYAYRERFGGHIKIRLQGWHPPMTCDTEMSFR